MEIYETSEGLRFRKHGPSSDAKISYGVFALKNLLTFTKCTTMCPVLTIYLMENYPVVLQYSVASLGVIRYCIASLQADERG